jgi:hypothetical protein
MPGLPEGKKPEIRIVDIEQLLIKILTAIMIDLLASDYSYNS